MPPARLRAGKEAKGLSTSLAVFLDTLDFFDSLSDLSPLESRHLYVLHRVDGGYDGVTETVFFQGGDAADGGAAG